MSNFLLDLLSTAGTVLDTPGAAFRGLLAGRNPLPGIFDPSQRVSGRGLLESLGALDAKGEEDGFGWGDAAGMGTEMLLDPMNLVGGAMFKRLLGSRGAARTTARQAVDPVLLDAQKKFRLAEALGEEEAAARSIRSVPQGYGLVSRAIDNLDPALLTGEVADPLAYRFYKNLRVGKASQDPVEELLKGFGVGGRTSEGALELVGPRSVKSVPGLEQRNAWVGAEPLTPPPSQLSRYTPFPPQLEEAAALSREASAVAQQKLQYMLEQMAGFRQQADSRFWQQGGMLGSSLLGHNALARSSGYGQPLLDPLSDVSVGVPEEATVFQEPVLPAAAPPRSEPSLPDQRYDVAARNRRAQQMIAQIMGALEEPQPVVAARTSIPLPAPPVLPRPPDPRNDVATRDRRARQMMAQIMEALEAPPAVVPKQPNMPVPAWRSAPVAPAVPPWTMQIYEGTGPNRRVFTQTY